jgi:hypothetical protein
MKPFLSTHVRSHSLIFLCAALVAATARAGSSTARAPVQVAAPRIDHSAMMYDAPGDGSVWARGQSYKASFDASGATYYPDFGARAPRNYPHVLSPDRVTIGGGDVAFVRAAAALRDGDRVVLDRGAFVESYELRPQSIEQTFVFATLPQRGELALHVPIASDLAGAETADGIEFQGELGRVVYGRATAIDALGRRSQATTELADGAITIRVDAGFVAQAALPLVVDPVLNTISFPSVAGADDFAADVAYDAGLNAWLAVWEETFSSVDTDAYCRLFDSQGHTMANGVIDFTTASWVSPRCANLAAAHQFLAVAGVTTGTLKNVLARTVVQNGAQLTISNSFDVSAGTSGDRINPDVGGDPYLGTPSFYCVVFEHVISSTQHEIGVRAVAPDGTLFNPGPLFLPSDPTAPDVTPSISKSDNIIQWTVAWERVGQISHGDIWAAHIHYDGTLVDGPFGVTASLPTFDFAPCASSSLLESHTRSVITFTRGLAPNRDIMVALIDGTSVPAIVDLNQLENGGTQSLDQIESSVDCDGEHFIVSYSESSNGGATPYTIYVDDVFASGSTLGLGQTHVLEHQIGFSQRRSRVSSEHLLSSTPHLSMIVDDFERTGLDHDIDGALFQAFEGGDITGFCYAGDNVSLNCPCSNNGAFGHGCANASNPQGALLGAVGVPSSVVDSLVLHSSGMPANATCVFLQGTTTNTGVVFGDGVRCAAGTLIRLAVKQSSGGAASYPGTGDLPITVKGFVPPNGGTRAYQAWYRDNSSIFCTSATFNISSGLIVNWAP